MQNDYTGILIGYVSLNLVSATEQLTMFIMILVSCIINSPPLGSGDDLPLLKCPPRAGDWLNIMQCGVAWMQCLAL